MTVRVHQSYSDPDEYYVVVDFGDSVVTVKVDFHVD